MHCNVKQAVAVVQAET